MSAPRSRFVRANGIAQHVLEWDGPGSATVLMLHGFLDQAESFGDIAARLSAAGHRVFAPDFRGHGRSGWVPEGGYYHFSDYVADVHALLAVLAPQSEVPQFSIVGHSMGGSVASLITGTFPSRIRALALLEGTGPPAMPAEVAPDRMSLWLEDLARPRVRERKKMQSIAEAAERLRATHGASVSASILERVAAELTEAHPSGDGIAWRFDPLHQTRSPNRYDEDAFREFVCRIRCPVLLVDAGESGMRIPNLAERRSFYTTRREVTIDGAGHMMHWTRPEHVADEVIAFFSTTL